MGDEMDEKKMDLSNLLGALRVNSLKAAISSAPMEKREKKKLVIPDSLRKTEALPFSPRKPFPQWSPRTVAQQTLEYIGQEEDTSPLRKLCRDSVEKVIPCRAIVHHIDVDPMKVKKSKGETTLHNVTTVNRRTQRAMTAEEVAENCEKSITFFQQARETNQKMAVSGGHVSEEGKCVGQDERKIEDAWQIGNGVSDPRRRQGEKERR
ncbi:unnamed protein product [Amoebophrya sp. A120]|nr:unnamed protein product [Amoebophrya sp. A120]|eukprot:GSA120T00005368001.1